MSHTFHRYRIGDEPVAGYRLVDHLGAGGFGEVWKANAPGGTEVALKIIDLTGQQGVQEFASLRVVKKVRHPNLISLQAFWMKDESGQIIDEAGQQQQSTTPLDVTMAAPDPQRQTQAIAMTAEFARPVELLIAMQLGSMSLHKRLEECREQGLPGIPVAELLEYLEQAARGIDFLNKPIHDLGKGPMPIVHGDIKPHNILVIGDAAVVCDFGLARAVETLRKTSMAPVTVAYASPESFKGKVTPQTDQYSLAVTYVELRTGRLPFDETLTPYQVMEAHVTRMLDFTRLPEQERQVILRATDPNPEARWPSSREMILALRHAVASTGELPLRPGEVAFTGGPTPTHSLTGRPMARDTDMPTRIPTDPHKDTAYPGGHTPAHLLSQRTAPGPFDARASDPLAETAMAPVAPRKKSRGLLIAGGLGVVAAGIAAVVFAPGLMRNDKTAAMLPSSMQSVENRKQDAPAKDVPDRAAKSTADVTPSVEPAPEDPNAQYIRLVQDKINDREFAAAVDLLDKAPSKLPEFEKESLQKRLRAGFVTFLDTQVQRRAYGRALVELDDAPAGIGLDTEEKQKQQEKIRQAWLEQAREEFANAQFNRAIEAAGNLLKRFDGDRDAQLIIARSQVRLGDNAAARTILEKLGKTTDLPAEYQPLHTGLLLLATGFDAGSPEAEKLLDGFAQYMVLEKDNAPPAALALTPWERDRLTALRTTVVSNLQQQLASLPRDQASGLLKKLEQLDSSVELQMFKVKSQLEAKQFAEARKTLAAVAANAPADDSALKTSIEGTSLLITLLDPASKEKEVASSGGQAVKIVTSVSPTLRAELAAALEVRASADSATAGQPSLRELAIEYAAKARDVDPLDQGATKRLARLLAARLTAKMDQPTLSKDELPQIVSDCEQVEAAGLNTAITDALHAECLMLMASPDANRIKELADRAAADQPYAQYVRTRALRARPQPDWPQIVDLLQKAYADPAKLSPSVAAPMRRAEAAQLLVEAAAKKRAPIQPSNPAAPLANPFTDAAAADEAYKLLQLAGNLAADLSAAGLKLPEARQGELSLNLGLASAWKTRPDEKTAHAQLASLVKSADTDLGANAFPVYLTALRVGKADAASAIQSAQRFLELFQKQYPVADLQAVQVYDQVAKPALELAEAQTRGKSPADLDKFYAQAADFISHYKRAAWPFENKQAEIERLLTKAITLNSKVAKYYTSRGVSRISQVPPNIDGALADAAAATKIDSNLPAAFGLQGHALIYRSRKQATRDARLADLEQALAKSTAAVEKAKTEEKDRGTHLLYLSMAHLEKANFETDPKVQKENLDKAVVYAQQTIDLEKAYPDYAYVALGNALEDLAWLLNDEPEKNYTAAIDAFSHAIESNLASSDPWIGRARCFYKAVVDSKLDPQFLGRTREEALQSAISDLQQAQQLNAEQVEPKLWLGKAYRELGNFAEADAALAAAVEQAEKQQLPERALYLIEWTRSALVNSALTPDERGQTVRERAEKLKTAPNLGGVSSAKQAALLIGDSLMAEKKMPEALTEYDAALADYDKADAAKPLDVSKADGSDVSLLLARAYCRLNLPETQWNLAAAEGVIKDAGRIKQLKPSPRFESLGHWYAANSRSRSLRSTSPSITPQHKLAFLDAAIVDVRNAIDTAPTDPGAWEWRGFGARLLGTKVTQTTDPATLKKYADEARLWIDDAISQAAKRPDLAPQLERLQRVQQELDTILAGKGLPRK